MQKVSNTYLSSNLYEIYFHTPGLALHQDRYTVLMENVWKKGKEKTRPLCPHKQAGLCNGNWEIFLKLVTSVAGLKKGSHA